MDPSDNENAIKVEAVQCDSQQIESSKASEQYDSNKQSQHQDETVGENGTELFNDGLSDQVKKEQGSEGLIVNSDGKDFKDFKDYPDQNKDHLTDMNNNLNEQLDYSSTSNKLIKDESDQQDPNKRMNRAPDPDAIKMFVGQLPRTWNEENCSQLFQEFGDIYSIKVLKDRDAKLSKGCCFVTFYERKAALKAQDALHNVRVLPGMHHAIQMRPADSENLHERKLYVSSLNKSWCEQQIRDLFQAYGHVEDINILKDSTGQNKGSAFVIFANKSSAFAATKALNQKKTLEGCNSPLIVRVAENQKERDARRKQMIALQQQQAYHPNANNQSNLIALDSHCQNSANPLLSTMTNSLFNVNYLNPALAYASLANNSNKNQSNVLTSSIANNQLNNGNPINPNELIINKAATNPNSKPHPLSNEQHLKLACSTITSAQQNALINESNLNKPALNQAQANLNGNQFIPPHILNYSYNYKNLFGGLDATQQSLYPYCPPVAQPALQPHQQTPFLNTIDNNLMKPLANLQTLSPKASINKFNSNLYPANILPTNPINNSFNNQQQFLPDEMGNYSIINAPKIKPLINLHQSSIGPNQINLMLNNSQAPSNKNKQLEGPEGANLFIYHLPPEFNDQQLAELFSSFGNLLSCKVYIDKYTKLSKCFGFVSYDNVASAQAAIDGMNGFHVLNKRLKVNKKKINKTPYDR